MSALTSLRDALAVASFHVRRARRTRTLLALCVVYVLTAGGVAWIFRTVVHEMEKAAAEVLRVPQTDTPGAMIDTLRTQDDFRRMMEGLIPDPQLLDWAMDLPVLTVSHFWMALGLLPFLAAAAGSEVLAPSVHDRSLRFELVRTGRLELVYGRWLGQAALVALATALSVVGPLFIGAVFMVEQPLGRSLQVLVAMTPPLVAWTLPFLGLGVAASQLTTNTNFARILALGTATATWIFYGLSQSARVQERVPVLVDLVSPLLPQSYMADLWGPGAGWLTSGGILLGLGLAFALLGYPRFARRNV